MSDSLSLNRRQALEALAVSAAALAVPHPAAAAGFTPVVDVRCPRWLDDRKEPVAAVVKQMVDTGLMTLTDEKTPKAAWSAVFGKYKCVGVKFNQISRNFSRANQVMLDAVAEGLQSAGIALDRIIVTEALGASLPGCGKMDKGWAGEYDFGSGKTRLSNFLINQVDAILNIPDLKDHERCGISGAIKNLSHARTTIMENPQNFHKDCCDPYITDLYALAPIREKAKLHLMNGLKGLFDLGPSPRPDRQWAHNGLLLGFDPVAVDKLAHDLVVAERDRRKLPSFDHRGTKPTFLASAVTKGLGTADLEKIKVLRVDL